MILTRSMLEGKAADIRAIDAELSAIIEELKTFGVWAGADADRFHRDWADEVHDPLHRAAFILGAATLVTSV